MSPSIESAPPTERANELLESEVLRRGRFLGGTGRVRDGAAALNVVISEAALCHRLRGLDVQWTSSRCGTVARPWAVRDALHLLLGNAARHTPGAGVGITAERHGHWAQVAVVDRGVRPRARPEEAPGIHLARRLLVGVGGTLRVDAAYVDGARFDIRLPVVGPSAAFGARTPRGDPRVG